MARLCQSSLLLLRPACTCFYPPGISRGDLDVGWVEMWDLEKRTFAVSLLVACVLGSGTSELCAQEGGLCC